jgi:VanZ family protein
LTRRFVRYWVPVLAYVGLIFVVSAQPRLRPPVSFHNADKFAHVVEYGILGFLLARALRGDAPSRDPLRNGLIALGIGLAVGAVDETFQSIVPGRESSVRDFFADACGLVLAQLAWLSRRP